MAPSTIDVSSAAPRANPGSRRNSEDFGERGGLGSGQWPRYGTPLTVESCPVLDIRLWHHRRYAEREGAVEISYTPCPFGGERAWWLCPGCGCRAIRLYQLAGTLRCRNCHRLVYASQRATAGDRAITRAQAIRLRMGGSASLLVPFPGKPPHMRWRAYFVLRARAEEADDRAFAEVSAGTTKFRATTARRWPL